MAISACNFRSSASSSSSSMATFLLDTALGMSALSLQARTGILTLCMRWRGQLVDCICQRHVACAQHLLINLLLLQIRQLSLQLVIVNPLANRVGCNYVDNFFAERILFINFIPVSLSVHRFQGSADIEIRKRVARPRT